MIWIYKILAYVLLIVSLPFLPLIYTLSSKRRANLLQRFGFRQMIPKKPLRVKRIWIHGLSVGETRSAFPFVEAFVRKNPQWQVIFTASTRTGYETAKSLFWKIKHPLVHHVAYFPFDIGFCIEKTAGMIGADAVVLVETDLWPNFLYEMNQKKIPVVLINARLSDKTFNGYKTYQKCFFPFYLRLDRVMAQTRFDAERLEKLGFDPSRILVPGNIKFDQPLGEADKDFETAYTRILGIEEKNKVFLAGSTHQGEEKILLKVFSGLKENHSELKMFIAPRDPKRAQKIARIFKSEGQKADLLSDLSEENNGGAVVIVDGLGILSRLYMLSDIAFVGGSMVRQGGHNPLEASAYGKPVLFGPDMSDFLEISYDLLRNKAAVQVTCEAELKAQLKMLLTDTKTCQKMGENGKTLFKSHKGAVSRIIEDLSEKAIV